MRYFCFFSYKCCIIDINKINLLSNELIDYNSIKKILAVGRLAEQKNIPLLINSFKSIHDNNLNTELWIVGDGPIKNKLHKLCKELQLEKDVIFGGFQENPYKFIKNADFIVSSSDYEGFCLVVFEAIILKKRVIVTKSITDFDKLITPDIGTIVPINNLSALTEAIDLETKNKVHTIVDNTKIQNMFSLSTIADKYIQYF